MIVLSPNFVLSLDAVSYADADLNNPVIGWQNMVAADNLVVSSQQELYPAENLLNTATNLLWKAYDTTEQTLTVTTGGADDVDYVAVARHNFGTALIQPSVETNDGSGWVETIPPFQPADDSPLIMRFDRGAYTGVRMILAEGDSPASIGVFYTGALLVLQRRVYVGHSPIPMTHQREVLTGMSETGEYLGRVVVRDGLATSLDLQNLSPLWYRQNMKDFIDDSADNPFFFAWRPSKYPDEVGFCWMTNSPKPVNQRGNGMMNISLQMGGLVL